MNRFALLPAVCAIGLLAACQDETTEATMPPEDACGAQALQSLVGQGESALAGYRDADKTRIIGPGTPVTMDYRHDRLNIEIDEDGTVTRVYCG